ncbi:Carboxylic ester hydrolase [Balamuthia mandrillaris]
MDKRKQQAASLTWPKIMSGSGATDDEDEDEENTLFFEFQEDSLKAASGSRSGSTSPSGQMSLCFYGVLALVLVLPVILFLLFATYDYISEPRYDDNLYVQTKYGPVVGFYSDDNKTRVFLGIPFATPPLGSLRWTPPTPPANWEEPLHATKYSLACTQFLNHPFLDQHYPVGEDCLYLNVFTPKVVPGPQDPQLPVMVWIFGGSFIMGSANLYDGSDLAAQGVIVVTINYRLGPFGFLALPELKAENPDQPTGFYGMLDQRAALQWVQSNIAAFGGDPSQVTVFGESAGGASAAYHLVANRSAGLFQRVLIQSGLFNVKTVDQGYTVGSQLVAALKCEATNITNCLRAKTTDELLHALPPETAFWPILDPAEFTQQPNISIHEGKFSNNISAMLIGTDRQETSPWLCALIPNMTAAQYAPALLLYGIKPPAVEEIIQLYPIANYSAPVQALIAATSDASFHCPTFEVANATSRKVAQTWTYSFDMISGFSLTLGRCFKAGHSLEVFFTFPSLLKFSKFPYTMSDAELKLSHFMLQAWTNFAKTGNPNPAGSSQWPPFLEQKSSSPANYFQLNATLSAATKYGYPNCPTFWHAYGPALPSF